MTTLELVWVAMYAIARDLGMHLQAGEIETMLVHTRGATVLRYHKAQIRSLYRAEAPWACS